MKNKTIIKGRKKGIILETDKVGSLAKFVNDFDNPNKAIPGFYANAVGSISDTTFIDKLAIPSKTYKLYDSLKAAREALKSGELKVNEPYCYSCYEYKNIFPELGMKTSKEEAILYIKELCDANSYLLNWTFLDDEEKEKLNKKILEANRKY